MLLVAHGDIEEPAAPDIGIEVRASAGAQCREVAEEIAAEIGGTDERIIWLRPAGWPGEVPES